MSNAAAFTLRALMQVLSHNNTFSLHVLATLEQHMSAVYKDRMTDFTNTLNSDYDAIDLMTRLPVDAIKTLNNTRSVIKEHAQLSETVIDKVLDNLLVNAVNTDAGQYCSSYKIIYTLSTLLKMLYSYFTDCLREPEIVTWTVTRYGQLFSKISKTENILQGSLYNIVHTDEDQSEDDYEDRVFVALFKYHDRMIFLLEREICEYIDLFMCIATCQKTDTLTKFLEMGRKYQRSYSTLASECREACIAAANNHSIKQCYLYWSGLDDMMTSIKATLLDQFARDNARHRIDWNDEEYEDEQVCKFNTILSRASDYYLYKYGVRRTTSGASGY
jgi:hypothetical protein